MSQLEDRLLQATSGETRLHPDEQRCYLGTFLERVVLLVTVEECASANVSKQLPCIIASLMQTYPTLTLKIASQLPASQQQDYLKMARRLSLPATIVSESRIQTPFGLVLHSDKAENSNGIHLSDYLTVGETVSKPQKKSFWSRFFPTK